MVSQGLLRHSAKLTKISRSEGSISRKESNTALTEVVGNFWRHGGSEPYYVLEDKLTGYGLSPRKRRADEEGGNPKRQRKLSNEDRKLQFHTKTI